MSIRYKIALLFAALAGLILFCVSFTVYFITEKELNDAFYTRLKYRASGTANMVTAITDSNYTALSKLDTSSVASLQNKSIVVLNYLGKVLYNYTDRQKNELALDNDVIEQAKIKGEYYYKLQNRDAVVLHYTTADNNFIVAVAAEDIDGKEFLTGLKRLLVWVFILFVIISFITGLVFAGILVKPIGRIIAEVKLISSNNLSQHINKGNGKDELYHLSQTFNELLDRIQESFIIQRRFISNASHELSTPLTSALSQLEVTLQRERNVDDYKAAMKSVYDDIKDLQQLTRSLLDIAKSGTHGSMELTNVRIDEVLMKAASYVQKIKAGYKVQLDFDTMPDDEQMITVFGNSNLLFIAFKNIIENGCKYSDDNLTTINVSFNNKLIVVCIKSVGDIIAEADIENVFQPFFRAETIRQKEGFGLGLTLTKRIFALHKSQIEVTSNPLNGTVFTITLPNSRITE